jgi:hypothetical protein
MLMKRRPSAILSFSNIPMLGALHEIARSTFPRIPEEISLASYDSIPNIELLSIRPVTARFDNTKIGKQCASAVLDRINDPTLPNRQFVFEPTIVPGNAASFFHPEK